MASCIADAVEVLNCITHELDLYGKDPYEIEVTTHKYTLQDKPLIQLRFSRYYDFLAAQHHIASCLDLPKMSWEHDGEDDMWETAISSDPEECDIQLGWRDDE